MELNEKTRLDVGDDDLQPVALTSHTVGDRVAVRQPEDREFLAAVVKGIDSSGRYWVAYGADSNGRFFQETNVDSVRICAPIDGNLCTRASNRGFTFQCSRTQRYHTENEQEGSDSDSVTWDNTACEVCGAKDCAERMILCDRCDKGFHTFCLVPTLHTIPNGKWSCKSCREKKRALFSPVKQAACWETEDVGAVNNKKKERRKHSSKRRMLIRQSSSMRGDATNIMKHISGVIQRNDQRATA